MRGLIIGLMVALHGALLTGPPALAQAVPVEEFVRRAYFGGLPYDEAKAYPPSAVPTLLRMLEDRAETLHWTNIVGVLGIIGDESVVTPLADFVRDGAGVLSPEEYRAKSSVPIALGYVVNSAGGGAALGYLLASLNPAVWNARGLNWTSPFHSSDGERNRQLSTAALLGLALSGHPQAGAALRSLATAAQVTGPDAAALRATAQEALREFDAVQRLGLSGYYAQPRGRGR